MKFNVKKSGSNDKGIWVYGTADLGGYEITSIFKTNLKEVLKVGETVSFKKIKMIASRNKNLYELEF